MREGVGFGSFLRALVGGEEGWVLRLGCEVLKIGKERGEGGGWSVTFKRAGETLVEVYDGLVLAVPASAALMLLENSASSCTVWDEHVVDIIKRCAESYVRRYAMLMKIPRTGKLCEKLFEKFKEVFCDSEGSHDGHQLAKEWGNMARELDCEGVGNGHVALLALRSVGSDEAEFVVHGRVGEEVLGSETVTRFFEELLGEGKWGKVDNDIDIISNECYAQARPEVIYPNRPLFPLRERGCVVCVADADDGSAGRVVAAGDWAVGLGVLSSAISSGIRAADVLVKGLGGGRGLAS